MPESQSDQTESEGQDGGDKPPLASNPRPTINAAPVNVDASKELPQVYPPKGSAQQAHNVVNYTTASATGDLVTSTNILPAEHTSLPLPTLSQSDKVTHPPEPTRPNNNIYRPTPLVVPPVVDRDPSGSASSSSPDYSSDSDSVADGAVSAASSRPPSRANSSHVADVKLKPSADNQDAKPGRPSASAPHSRAPSIRSLKSDEGSQHRFHLKDLLGNAPKLRRKNSGRSDTSSRRSDSDQSSTGGPESTGSLLKKYGVCGKVAIGKGATSVVRLIHKWDRTEEKLYAVKEFRKRRKNETEKEYVKKLTSEFCISSTLHHVNIVETVDLVQDESHHWCEVMEYCPGGDLYAAIKRGGMTPPEIECCFKQILSGLAYLHSQGVAHRDIKPENLFFDGKGHLKIGDYGASTVYRLPWEATVHKSTGLCGSEPYIAPEQFTNIPYDARLVDVWACGVVYYCMHFQELPWRVAQTSDPLYSTYASACASSPTNCPPTISNLQPRACRPLLRKMLEPDPKLRTLIEEAINHPWLQGIEVCYSSKTPKHVHVQVHSFKD